MTIEKQGGIYVVNGRAVAAGVVCKCLDDKSSFCPAHGSKKLTEHELSELSEFIRKDKSNENR